MHTSNASAMAKSLGKRKVREADAETSAAVDLRLNLNTHHHVASARVQNLLNNAASTPFAFMPLLLCNGDSQLEEDGVKEEEEENFPIAKDVENQTDQINQMLTHHNEGLRQSVLGMLQQHNYTLHCAAEERAAKRLHETDTRLQEQTEKHATLERMVEHYKGVLEQRQRRVRYLNQNATSLSILLHSANEARRLAETVQEEKSSCEDPDRVEPVNLECRVCHKKLSTVMAWPCRHLCLCTGCDSKTKICPVCREVKEKSIEGFIPL